ncbi:MAG: transglycosylase domain-containing protein, partial [Ramlibacter sp.]
MRIDRAELLARLHLAWGRVRRLPTELLMVLPLALLLFVLVQVPFMPSPDEVRRARLEQSSTLVAADGTVLARFTRVHREWRSLDQMPQHLVQALLATEDHRFFRHHGIDLRRTAAAAWRTLRGDRQGGSTLTQQLARNLYPEEVGRAPTLTRKVREALTAIKIEVHATKPEILETYLNTVPFLYNAVGVEMGARTYFGKPAAQLDVLESATLVGMLKGTSYYNPHQNPERSRERRNLVLAQMARQGFLSEDKLQRLQAQPLRVRFQPQDEVAGPAPHLAQHVRGWLKDWAGRHGRDIYADGLVVRTTVHAP